MMKQFMASWYTPNRMVLVGAGGVKHADMVKAAEASFTMAGGALTMNDMLPKNYTAGLVRSCF